MQYIKWTDKHNPDNKTILFICEILRLSLYVVNNLIPDAWSSVIPKALSIQKAIFDAASGIDVNGIKYNAATGEYLYR